MESAFSPSLKQIGMREPSFPRDWKTLYAAAMLESDGTRIRRRIESAKGAIHARLKELGESSSVCSEQMDLQSALRFLHRLQDNLTSGGYFRERNTASDTGEAAGKNDGPAFVSR